MCVERAARVACALVSEGETGVPQCVCCAGEGASEKGRAIGADPLTARVTVHF